MDDREKVVGLIKEFIEIIMALYGRNVSFVDMYIAIYAWQEILKGNTLLSPYAIAEDLQLPYSTVTRMMRKYVNRGGVVTVPHPHDARRQQYLMTQQGMDRLRMMVGWSDKWKEIICD